MNIKQKQILESYIKRQVKKILNEGHLIKRDVYNELAFEFDSFGATFDLKLSIDPLYNNEKIINLSVGSSAGSKAVVVPVPDSLLVDFQNYMKEEDKDKKDDMFLDIGKRLEEYITTIEPKLQKAIDKFDDEIVKIFESNAKVLR